MEGSRFDVWTRRQFGLAAGGAIAGLLGGIASQEAGAKAIDNTPYAFARIGKLRRLERVTITLTIEDGDTEMGDSDHGKLSLALDGIDSGILLDGFPDGKMTLTRGGVPDNAAQILAALKTDGELEASIIDHNPVLETSSRSRPMSIPPSCSGGSNGRRTDRWDGAWPRWIGACNARPRAK